MLDLAKSEVIRGYRDQDVDHVFIDFGVKLGLSSASLAALVI